MYNTTELRSFVNGAPEASHFILLSEPNIKVARYPWNATKPPKDEVLAHIEACSTNRIGLIPSSMGWGIVDYDGESSSELQQTAKALSPVAKLPTPGGEWNRHLVLHLDKEELHQYHKNRKLDFGDWRCGAGYVVLYPGCESELNKALELTLGVPRVGGFKHPFEGIFQKQGKRAKKKKKRAPEEGGRNRITVPLSLGMDEADEVHWMLKQIDHEGQFIYLKNKFLLGGKDADSVLVSHLRFICNHQFSREVITRDGGVETHPINMSASKWDEAMKAIMYRTQCDPLGDWIRAQTHPDISTIQDAYSYARSWFHELFRVVGSRTELSEYLSFLIIVGIVARRRYPGIIIKHYPVIAGPSNTGKTALVENLLPEEFHDYAQPRLNLKKPADDLVYDVAGMSVVELNEMGSTRKADSAHIKGWLSEGYFKGRLRYGRSATSIPFTHFIVGTANLDDAPLPADPVAAERFFVQEIERRPHDPNSKIGIVEEYMARNRTKMFAAGNMIVDSWEVEGSVTASRTKVQHKLRTVPNHLRVGHSERAQEYSYNPYPEAEMKVWEWLVGEHTTYGVADHHPFRQKETPEGDPCWGLSDIGQLVPEFGKVRSSGDKSKILIKLGFSKVRLTKGKWRDHNVYVISKELADRIMEVQTGHGNGQFKGYDAPPPPTRLPF